LFLLLFELSLNLNLLNVIGIIWFLSFISHFFYVFVLINSGCYFQSFLFSFSCLIAEKSQDNEGYKNTKIYYSLIIIIHHRLAINLIISFLRVLKTPPMGLLHQKTMCAIENISNNSTKTVKNYVQFLIEWKAGGLIFLKNLIFSSNAIPETPAFQQVFCVWETYPPHNMLEHIATFSSWYSLISR